MATAVPLRALRFAGVAAALAQSPGAGAQPEQAVGDTGGAMPGFVRVGAAGPFDTGLVLAGLAGYGYRGAAIADRDRHHRAALDVASSFRPLPWLAVAARFSGRYDRHTDTGTGSGGDSGWVGDPRVAARATAPIGGGGLWLAAHAGLWIPGRDVPSLDPGASTVDLIGLVSWSPPAARFSLGIQGGFRFDQSARSVDQPDQLSPSDRMALGVSESDAVLLGAGGALRTGATEWVGEWSWDALVGDRAPDRRSWPMRLGAGARHWLTPAFAAQLQMEVSLAGTPGPDEARLFPIEPRFQALAGISFQPGRQRDRRPGGHPPAGAVAEQPERATAGPPVGRVAVVVTDLEGGPLSDAEVVVQSTARPGLAARAARTGADGRAELAGIERGPAELRVTHPKHRADSRAISVSPGRVSALRIALEPALPPGQLRGVVRSFDRGRPLAAELEVEPIGIQIRCDPRGEFEIDLPPGDYEVSIGAPGYRAQHRRVRIEQDGVTILNADLRR
jgi:hypothetical protein